MHKSKKKTKSAKIPQPIKVKKEKTEEERMPQPMSHYIDDRLELVKQIFGTLKPKTITNLAPEFLKKKNMEEVEELCLNELLCISTKRLLSIINASKCPTDTESDNDSDVERKEEHISLEEISSDSEIEGASSSKAKKKKRPGDASSSAGAKKIATKNPAEKDTKDGQMSVLELLELQARARAIRSQLALEPVTKIEVNSDEDNDEVSQKSSRNPKSNQNERKRKSSDKERPETVKSSSTSNAGSSSKHSHSKSNGSTEPKPSSGNSDKESSKRTGRKIKLKRDYSASVQEKNDIEAGIAVVRTEPTAEATAEKEVKREAVPTRSPSPDVIPIVAEPETLLISDSSDMEDEASKATTKPVDTNQLVVKVNASNERQVSKPSQSDKPKNERQMTEKPQTVQPPIVNKEEVKRARKNTEPEEGELSESEGNDKSDTVEELNSTNEDDVNISTEVVLSNDAQDTINEKGKEEAVNDENNTADAVGLAIKPLGPSNHEDSSSSTSSSESETETQEKAANQVQSQDASKPIAKSIEIISNIVVEQTSTSTPVESSSAMTTTPEEDDDQNDDVISLEGGDLENEMIEHFEAEKKADAEKKPKTLKVEPKDEDIISLDSSEDERKASWHSRYLKSSKVNKVLLTSRLGKRVRDNIRKSKRSKKDLARDSAAAAADEATAAAKAASSVVFTSQHEDGSVEQYKELLEMRQRKAKE